MIRASSLWCSFSLPGFSLILLALFLILLQASGCSPRSGGSTGGGSTSGGSTSGGTTSGGGSTSGSTSGGSTSGGGDTTPPDTSLTTYPPNPSLSPTATFAFTATETANFECSLDGAAYTPCSSPKSYSGLSDGSHTFSVRAIDLAGNVDPTPASYTWVVDTIPPDTTLTLFPSSPTGSAVTFTFTSSESATFQCSLDGEAWASCSSPKGYTGLADGSHTFLVRAIDPAGNVDPTPANYTFTVDTLPPDTTLTGYPSNPTNSSSATFTFTANEAATFECSLDGGAYTPCSSPQSYSGLGVGSHTFSVRARDLAGNLDPTPESYTWEVAGFSGLRDLVALSDSSVMLFWDFDANAVAYEICQSQTRGSCVTSFTPTYTVGRNVFKYQISQLTPGVAYYFVVKARYGAGNRDGNTVERKRELLGGVAKIAAGGAHTCALLSDGTVRCWGRNNYGQLGSGSYRDSDVPVVVSGLSNVVSITAGGFHACALLSYGTIRCWGLNSSGQLGNGTNATSSTLIEVEGLTDAVAIAAGARHTCALVQNGTVWCWGNNSSGQLGNGTNNDSYTPAVVSGLTNVVQIATGGSHTCALLQDDTLRCWGDNLYGQLGDGSYSWSSNTPVTVYGLSNAVAIAAGVSHTCALLSDGTARCWGRNNYGQLGNGTYTNASTPVTVSGLSNAVAIAAGGDHTCALLSDGTTRCWGRNNYGQLGNGTNTNSNTPVTVSGLTNTLAIAAGGNADVFLGDSAHTCALLQGGTVRCWGNNYFGQLGNGWNGRSSRVPVVVSGLSGAIAIAAGNEHACALLQDDTALCWGRNNYGQLGNGSYTDSDAPVVVLGLSGAVAIAGGVSHTCALLSDSTVRCWGNNGWGQLGNGTFGGGSSTPVAVSGLSGAIALAAGGDHTCALLLDGTVRCWGRNTYGQLGNGTNIDSSTPVPVFGLSSTLKITAGMYHSCALLQDGAVRCWGRSDGGRLGNGTNTGSSETPVVVANLDNAVEISAGEAHTCAVLQGGTVSCWGSDYSTTPVAISGLNSAISIAAGGGHTCALLSDGTVRCWGRNTYGQLGNNMNTYAFTPVTVSRLMNAMALAAGADYTCALLNDGTVRCWGDNFYGQIGLGFLALFWYNFVPVILSP